MNCGVYKISCGRRFYIGSSKEIAKRWKRHMSRLKAKTHDNQYMQNLYNKTGGKGFTFEVIIGCAEEDRWKFEQDYIDLHWGNPNFMNLSKSAYSGPGMTGRKHSDESIEKIRQANIGNSNAKGHTKTPEGIERLRQANIGNSKRSIPIDVLYEDGTTEHYLSMRSFAKAAGVGEPTVSRWIKGKRKPSASRGIKEVTLGHL